MREMSNSQHGAVKRFTYNGPNSTAKDNSAHTDDWFSGAPTKSKSDQSLVMGGTELDDVWSIRKNVSTSLNKPSQLASKHASNTGYYSRHGQYSKSSKLDEGMAGLTTSDPSGMSRSGGYSYGQSRSSYSYAGAAGVGPGQSTSPRFPTGPSTTQGIGKGGGGFGKITTMRGDS
ncbi:uncharacterized protein [Diadema antillarum]|uniref:uncharacterized protein n=1 Tax=Diadema antillarum TaxID=105358 RepID=UPI003A8C11B8